MQGIETLPLRMKKHIENTHSILDFLVNHEMVEWVKHPDLETHPDHEVAKEYYQRIWVNRCFWY